MEKINISLKEFDVDIHLDGRQNPLEAIIDSKRISFNNLNELSINMAQKLNLNQWEIKKKIYSVATEEFKIKESDASDSHQGIVSLLSGKPYFMVESKRNHPKKYFSNPIIPLSDSKTQLVGKVNRIRKKIKSSKFPVREYYKFINFSNEKEAKEIVDLEKEGYLKIDFSNVINHENFIFLGKIHKKGKSKNMFGDPYEWYVVDQLSPNSEELKLDFFTYKNKCVGNLSNLREEWSKFYDDKSFLKYETPEDIFKHNFSFPHYQKMVNSNLSEPERKQFFVGGCLEEIVDSYLGAHEPFHVSDCFQGDIFASELMAYLYQMYKKPSFSTLFYMSKLARNIFQTDETKAVSRILDMYSTFSGKEGKNFAGLPLLDFKEMSNVIYCQLIQDMPFLYSLRDNNVEVGFKD